MVTVAAAAATSSNSRKAAAVAIAQTSTATRSATRNFVQLRQALYLLESDKTRPLLIPTHLFAFDSFIETTLVRILLNAYN
ncbi:predicted protein [Lichtheimia corymbifera JMRC:FSU:9682]|uniref:Uncharacterized protein n=1 Tax=Lichtheimia corymbifera JMRC:FSU:9682 TaxID=1263082 RepID=A0A068S945_9FUNG|nr:predicted protein [Lichtheimia corymbifera JMRC:FSU:9682]